VQLLFFLLLWKYQKMVLLVGLIMPRHLLHKYVYLYGLLIASKVMENGCVLVLKYMTYNPFTSRNTMNAFSNSLIPLSTYSNHHSIVITMEV
jgi:hypothetical protein